MNDREKRIFDKYTALGYDVIKSGMPDITILKDGKIEFIEVKNDRSKLTKLQKRAFEILNKHGFSVKLERISGRTQQEIEKNCKLARIGPMDIDDDLEARFRQEIVRRFGGKKGDLTKAVEEALELWLKTSVTGG